MDRGAWWAAVHGVAKSQTRLSDFPFTFHFHALEKEMATHSSVLAWRIPWMEEPGRLPSMGSHKVGHNWSDLAAAAAVDSNMKSNQKGKNRGMPEWGPLGRLNPSWMGNVAFGIQRTVAVKQNAFWQPLKNKNACQLTTRLIEDSDKLTWPWQCPYCWNTKAVLDVAWYKHLAL